MDPDNPTPPCNQPPTNAWKEWPYNEYYIGERDEEGRKTGHGQYFWSGAESLECYTGRFLRDTKHGLGEYHCRHRGVDERDITWEGYYYNNCKHGYGLTSYYNGRVFTGLFHNNLRWGPGVETHISLRENVGLWKGDMLVRLTWKPPMYSVSPDLMSSPIGINLIAKHRTILVVNAKPIGETNPALELLKRYGAPPLAATKKWPQLYPKHCTDDKSQFFHKDVFDRDFYGNTIYTLEPISLKPEEVTKIRRSTGSNSPMTYSTMYYAWNNNPNIIHMMMHCYQHDKQIKQPKINLAKILNGPRTNFKSAAQDELDCRTFLMACYLGHIKHVAQLINEYDVSPNVADMQGNSAIMYATCGNQPDVINFLVEAGGLINDYNDACCTPLGVALINYACARCDIHPSKIVQAILPPSVTFEGSDLISEWQIERKSMSPTTTDQGIQTKSPNNKTAHKLPQSVGSKLKHSTSASMKLGKISEHVSRKDSKAELDNQNKNQVFQSIEPFAEDKRLYFDLLNEYVSKVTELFTIVDPKVPTPVPYIFEVNDMVLEIDLAFIEEQKKVPDKKDAKEPKRISKTIAAGLPEGNKSVMSEIDQIKNRQMIDQMTTIKQLLLVGADPRRVNCPQSALFTAIVSQTPELIQMLIKHGADINEVYTKTLGYSPLDIAVSKPFSDENLEVIQTLLENGAGTNHRIPIVKPDLDNQSNVSVELGPTLLHVVLTKKAIKDIDEKLRYEVLELLLDYGCDPIAQYVGRSAMDIAMTKDIRIFNIFIESPNTDLNAVINECNQSILVKMFYLPYCKTIPVAERLHMLTSLLLYGADPLLKCQNGENTYDNLFVYTKESDMAKTQNKIPSIVTSKDSKKTKPEPPKKKPEPGKSEQSGKSAPKSVVVDEAGDFQQTLSLVRDCARLLFIRWLQAKLMKEIVEVADKYKHRNWVMILKEYKTGKRCGLWLTAVRCLEIWDILKTTKKRVYNDKIVLKCVLCIVHYHFKRRYTILREISTADKASIESEVAYFYREHTSTSTTTLSHISKRPYVKPELTPDTEFEKFNICFECATPLKDSKISCGLCKLVDFCSLNCMKENIERINCHPCSNYLKKKYFLVPELKESVTSKPAI